MSIDPSPNPAPVPCPCCFDCTGKAKGTIFYCDGNGGCTAIAPPVGGANAILKFNGTLGVPYWDIET